MGDGSPRLSALHPPRCPDALPTCGAVPPASARCSRRCRPLLPAAPGGVWEARSSRSLGRADRAVPANQDREASRRLSPQPCGAWRGAVPAALLLHPPDPRAPSVARCWSPEAAPQHGWVWVGGLVWHPPPADPRHPSPSLCRLEGVVDPHCHGNVAFCMPARSLPWQCGVVLLGKEGGMEVGRRAWAWLCWGRDSPSPNA